MVCVCNLRAADRGGFNPVSRKHRLSLTFHMLTPTQTTSWCVNLENYLEYTILLVTSNSKGDSELPHSDDKQLIKAGSHVYLRARVECDAALQVAERTKVLKAAEQKFMIVGRDFNYQLSFEKFDQGSSLTCSADDIRVSNFVVVDSCFDQPAEELDSPADVQVRPIYRPSSCLGDQEPRVASSSTDNDCEAFFTQVGDSWHVALPDAFVEENGGRPLQGSVCGADSEQAVVYLRAPLACSGANLTLDVTANTWTDARNVCNGQQPLGVVIVVVIVLVAALVVAALMCLLCICVPGSIIFQLCQEARGARDEDDATTNGRTSRTAMRPGQSPLPELDTDAAHWSSPHWTGALPNGATIDSHRSVELPGNHVGHVSPKGHPPGTPPKALALPLAMALPVTPFAAAPLQPGPRGGPLTYVHVDPTLKHLDPKEGFNATDSSARKVLLASFPSGGSGPQDSSRSGQQLQALFGFQAQGTGQVGAGGAGAGGQGVDGVLYVGPATRHTSGGHPSSRASSMGLPEQDAGMAGGPGQGHVEPGGRHPHYMNLADGTDGDVGTGTRDGAGDGEMLMGRGTIYSGMQGTQQQRPERQVGQQVEAPQQTWQELQRQQQQLQQQQQRQAMLEQQQELAQQLQQQYAVDAVVDERYAEAHYQGPGDEAEILEHGEQVSEQRWQEYTRAMRQWQEQQQQEQRARRGGSGGRGGRLRVPGQRSPSQHPNASSQQGVTRVGPVTAQRGGQAAQSQSDHEHTQQQTRGAQRQHRQ